jgi:hypothetical protein
VPLSGRTLEILKALPREGDFVFPGGRQGTAISSAAMVGVLKHGYANHVIEMALAHAIGDKVELSYRRSPNARASWAIGRGSVLPKRRTRAAM